MLTSPAEPDTEAGTSLKILVLRHPMRATPKGVSVTRMRYEATGESAMYSDAWVKDRNLLIEAKSAQGRDALRQAIGQLYDYRRFHDTEPVLAVLLAYEPTGDRGALLHSASIGAIWPRPRGPGFCDTAGGAYV